jgi:hypothetical protein
LSRFSLPPSSSEYPDSNPHAGFNNNFYFTPPDPHRDGFNDDLNVAYPPGGFNGASPAHHRVPVQYADQGGVSPSSSSYFSGASQDAHKVFGGMGG